MTGQKLKELWLDDMESKEAPLWHHEAGLAYTASGYGGKIPSTKKVRYNGRWYRVYVCAYSNGGTAYIQTKNGYIVIN